MGKISVLDCTLRDGGYINDWFFGKEAIRFIIDKLEKARLDYIEVGFIKPVIYDPDRCVFPDIQTINSVLPPEQSEKTVFAGMIDMGDPIPMESIPPHSNQGIDVLRIIFKQNKIDLGFDYVKHVISKGYRAMVQLVSTDTYSDDELVDVINRFNELRPEAIYIVDSLGLIQKREFLHMVSLMDRYMSSNIMLGYHSHNNLQQARQNAESLVELGLSRDLLIDACVFGMGRGAGNLNEELFLDYLNLSFGSNYFVEPLLEIIDEYLNDIYKNNYWGYSLHYYLSAKNKVHPNYAKYYHAKGTLTEKAFDELLKTISKEDSHIYSDELANKYYLAYMERYVDDREAIAQFSKIISNGRVLIIAPGQSIDSYHEGVTEFIKENNPIVISVGFIPTKYHADYVFCSNIRNYDKIKRETSKLILTSNIHHATNPLYIFNYDSYLSKNIHIIDNGGLLLLKILRACDIKEVYVAGMDGYSFVPRDNKINNQYISTKISNEEINFEMKNEIAQLRDSIKIYFITPTLYE